MINGTKAFGDIKKTHACYLVFVNIIQPIIDDAKQTCLRGMAFKVCRLVECDKIMLFQISNVLVSHQLLHYLCYMPKFRNETVVVHNIHVSIVFN